MRNGDCVANVPEFKVYYADSIVYFQSPARFIHLKRLFMRQKAMNEKKFRDVCVRERDRAREHYVYECVVECVSRSMCVSRMRKRRFYIPGHRASLCTCERMVCCKDAEQSKIFQPIPHLRQPL